MVSDADRRDHVNAVVAAAIGMTMEYLDCSGIAALEALNAHAQRNGQSLVSVAVDVIERRHRPA